MNERIVDLRMYDPVDWRPILSGVIDDLAPGDGFILVSDHDQAAILSGCRHEHGDIFTARILASGPAVWQTTVTRKTDSLATRGTA